MKSTLVLLSVLLSLLLLFTFAAAEGLSEQLNVRTTSSPDKKAALARCLTNKGWAMYSSITCSACRAQKKAFEEAFSIIKHIECNPHAENTRVELCIRNKIRNTPTWIREENGKEIQRFEGYYLLNELATLTRCKSSEY